MTILIYFLTIVFGIVCFVIMKKKRYKVMPLICLIMFICFIGCGIVSILSLTLPYGEILVYPLGAIIFGLVFILVGVNDLYSLLRCREKSGTACIVATIHIMVAMAFLHNLQYLNIHITELIIVSKTAQKYNLIND